MRVDKEGMPNDRFGRRFSDVKSHRASSDARLEIGLSSHEKDSPAYWETGCFAPPIDKATLGLFARAVGGEFLTAR